MKVLYTLWCGHEGGAGLGSPLDSPRAERMADKDRGQSRSEPYGLFEPHVLTNEPGNRYEGIEHAGVRGWTRLPIGLSRCLYSGGRG